MKNKIVTSLVSVAICFYLAEATFAQEPGSKTVSAKSRYDGIVRIGTNAILGSSDSTKGLFVLNGDALIDGKVEENAVIVRGNAEINGEIGKNIVSILGSVKIGSKAKIGGDIILVGSKADISQSAEISGNRIDIDFGKILPGIGWIFDYIRYGVLMFRPFPPQVKVVWGVAILTLLFNIILLVVFPRAINTCIETVQNRPVSSFLIGLIACCLIAPLIIALLALSVVGVVAIPFVICAALVASIFGKVAVYRFIGFQVGKIRGGEGIASPVAALIIGSILAWLVYMLPIIGLIGWSAVTIIGLGCALISAVDKILRESPKICRKEEPARTPPSTGFQSPGVQGENLPAGEVKPQTTPQTQTGAQTQFTGAQIEQQQTPAAALPPLILQAEKQITARPPFDYSMLPRAGFWRRLAATLIDLCVFIIPFSIFHSFGLVLWLIYHLVMWKLAGSTVGGIVMRIKIVKENGAPIDWQTAFVRVMSAMLSAIPLFIGFFWAGWSRDKKAWHDFIAGTIVVKVPPGVNLK